MLKEQLMKHRRAFWIVFLMLCLAMATVADARRSRRWSYNPICVERGFSSFVDGVDEYGNLSSKYGNSTNDTFAIEYKRNAHAINIAYACVENESGKFAWFSGFACEVYHPCSDEWGPSQDAFEVVTRRGRAASFCFGTEVDEVD
jgi:hypothetical protein